LENKKSELLINILDGMWNTYDWTDPMDELLNDWTPELACKPLHPNITSVEAMINHTCFWEDVALRLLTGASLDDLGPLEEAADGKYASWMPSWPETFDNYRSIRGRIRAALKTTSDADLAVQPDHDNVIRETRISSRAAHAAYHAGQLVFMRQLADLPEPEPFNKSADTAPKAVGAKKTLQDLMAWAWTSGYSFDTFPEVVKDVSSKEADESIHNLPSITHIVNHMAFWEDYVARRLRGEDTDSMPVAQPGGAPPDSLPWPDASSRLLKRHQEVEDALDKLNDEDLWSPRPGNGKQFEEGKSGHWLVWGIINHHAYHVGQIVLLRQMMGHGAFFI